MVSDAQGKSDSGPEILPQPSVEAPARRDGPGGFGGLRALTGGCGAAEVDLRIRLTSSVPLWRAGEANVAPHVGGGSGRGRVEAGPRGQGATGRRVGRGTGEVSLKEKKLFSYSRKKGFCSP